MHHESTEEEDVDSVTSVGLRYLLRKVRQSTLELPNIKVKPLCELHVWVTLSR